MKTIEVIIDKVGRPTYNANGFAGGECTQKTKPLIDALHDPAKGDAQVTEKPEMFQSSEESLRFHC